MNLQKKTCVIIYQKKSNLYIMCDDEKNAIKEIERAFKLFPNDRFTNNLYIIILFKQGRFDEINKHLLNLSSNSNDTGFIYFLNGQVFYLKEEYEIANQYFARSSEIDPNICENYKYLDESYYQLFNKYGEVEFNEKSNYYYDLFQDCQLMMGE